ncbi:hypothetical protein [Streptomyces chromofuscus]|uniref:Cysteinyl-tRNA synthetase n=1 Tax=Streptomyces chromofuscus TaxID=42881 RepID=A0A7M2T9S5_STRCW|nr:hypothetical protein [Streptomyces chromofuscus]QOV45420.1 hypothetical protein IPT68_05595 [Streptomyces chromofuscus]GGS97669.1 hypothetical protein GCM10010254_16960 [Streptomyces chromofuscus]
MLRIIDARTGEPVDASTTRRGLTCVEAHAPALDLTALRVLLVADVLVRALELGGTPVWGLLSGDRDRAELREAAAALGIRPFEDRHDAGAGLGERQVIHVVGEGGANPDGVRVAVARVSGGLGVPVGDGFAGPVRGDSGMPVGHGPGMPESGGLRVPVGDGSRAPLGDDPAVLRLALLSRPRSVPARVDDTALSEARDTLARWRRAVADWARHPSRPVPEEVRGQLRTAWEDDLDIPSVLGVLRRVEGAPGLPDGARFETYAYADRLLALDLTRDLGAPA